MKKLLYERPTIRRLMAGAGTAGKFGPAAGAGVRPVPEVAGVPVAGLLAQYGSPLFVLSERQLRRDAQALHRAFGLRYPRVQLAWSYKTNYLNAVCRVFHQEGAWAEVVSGFELEKALGNGVPGPHILFNGPGKTAADLLRAAEVDAVVHLDNFDELHRLLAVAAGRPQPVRVAVRVSLDAGLPQPWSRFGFSLEDGQAWVAIRQVVAAPGLALVGLHCHLGTFVLEPAAYGTAAAALAALALRAEAELGAPPVDYLDLGGGFPSANTLKGSYLPGPDLVPDLDEYAAAVAEALLAAGFAPEALPLLVLEAGRALVDEAGTLLGTVLATKRLPDGRRATILDFGVNLLFTAYWYDHAIQAAHATGLPEPTVLYGPLCMNIDVLREAALLPPLAPGDAVVVPRVGAYNLSQWQQFITLRPNVVLVDMQGDTHVIRAAETLAYLEQPERVPAHLR